MIGVSSPLRASNSSVSAALPCSSRGTSCSGLLRGDGVAGQFQELAQEVEAGLLDVGVLLPQRVEALPELDEDRVVEVARDPGGDLLLDLLDRDVLALPGHQVLDGLRIQDDRFGALRDLDLDVLVDQVDRLRAESVPHQTTGDVGRADGLVDVGQPAVVIAILAQASDRG